MKKTELDFWRPIYRWNPLRDLQALQTRMGGLMEEAFGPEASELEKRGIDFIPSCDLEETDSQYRLTLDVPGMKREDLKVELSGNTLTVSGEKKEEKKEETGTRRYFERYQGRFERSFTLPQVSETEKVQAIYKDGVLKIEVPKMQAAKGRRIEIGEGKGLESRAATRGEEKKEKAA